MNKQAAAEVTPVRQRSQYTCMATSMMMCLKANGVPDLDEDVVNKVMGAQPMQGASWESALACAQHFGMRATLTVPATLRQVKEWTDRGVPVMIAWNPEGREWSHASVIFDVEDDLTAHVADPNIPDPDETVRIVPKDEFYKKWYEKWPSYLVRRPAMAIEREITQDGKQVVASSKQAVGDLTPSNLLDRMRLRQAEKIRALHPKPGMFAQLDSWFGDVWGQIEHVYPPDRLSPEGRLTLWVGDGGKHSDKVKTSYESIGDIRKVLDKAPSNARVIYTKDGKQVDARFGSKSANWRESPFMGTWKEGTSHGKPFFWFQTAHGRYDCFPEGSPAGLGVLLYTEDAIGGPGPVVLDGSIGDGQHAPSAFSEARRQAGRHDAKQKGHKVMSKAPVPVHHRKNDKNVIHLPPSVSRDPAARALVNRPGNGPHKNPARDVDHGGKSKYPPNFNREAVAEEISRQIEAGWQDTLKGLWKTYKKNHPKSEKPPKSLIDEAKAEAGKGKDKQDAGGSKSGKPKVRKIGPVTQVDESFVNRLRTKLKGKLKEVGKRIELDLDGDKVEFTPSNQGWFTMDFAREDEVMGKLWSLYDSLGGVERVPARIGSEEELIQKVASRYFAKQE